MPRLDLQSAWRYFRYNLAQTRMPWTITLVSLCALFFTWKTLAQSTLLDQALFYDNPASPFFYWPGGYAIAQSKLLGLQPHLGMPLFESIRQGEVWRLFTPCLLHVDVFHLFLNSLWCIALGRQLEARLKTYQYLLFIVISGILSNTAQYLMGGFHFMGLSGVVCGMFAYIWIQQRDGASGYELHPGMALMMAFYVGGAFVLQVLSFFLESFGITFLSTGIANTAHLTGIAVGLLIGTIYKAK